ncbi:MAG: hypothetical protein ACREIC_18085 [Limisphaerales bacterium]
MSLLRLLTAGKSLVGLKDQQSRYVTRGVLPKFGSKKNPFRATVRPDAALSAVPARNSSSAMALTPGSESETERALGWVKAVAPGVVAGEEADRVVVAVEKGPAQPHAGTANSGISKPRSVRGEKGWNWGKMAFWNKPGPARQAPPELGKPMFQGELSLEGVKVMRNDLSDTDLEVVPCKPAVPAAMPAPTPPPAAAASPQVTTWGRVTGRIFGAGKV